MRHRGAARDDSREQASVVGARGGAWTERLAVPSSPWRLSPPTRHTMEERIFHEYSTRGVCCLRGVINPLALGHLREECDALSEGASDATLLREDCVVEIPPAATVPPGDPARRERVAYLKARKPRDEGLLLHSLPAFAAAALNTESSSPPCLFNEHYICKPARVAGSFRWHTDAAHQLEALVALGGADACRDVDTEYLSMWIPLDPITANNGALTLLPLDAPQPPGTSSINTASVATLKRPPCRAQRSPRRTPSVRRS